MPFAYKMFPIVFVAWIATLFFMRYLFKEELSIVPEQAQVDTEQANISRIAEAAGVDKISEIDSAQESIEAGAVADRVVGALSPQARNSQVGMFEAGEVDFIVATDAIGMGLNLNIENVSFASLEKYDGKKKRKLKKNEIAQIAGRAGRNEKDGYFSNTPQTGQLSKQLIDSIEQNLFDPINFLYWRNRSLEFTSVESLLKSLNEKSNNPLLIKTLNIRDENILKHLAVNTEVIKYLSDYECIKILWEISKIPDYMKSIDFENSGLLVKLFLNLVQNGKIDYEWVKHEVTKLQN